jgi:hypothetical protein
MTTIKNHYLEMDEDSSDFGFTFTDEDDVVETNLVYSSLSEEVSDLKLRLQAIQKIYLPLLENLNKENDKPMIKWPGRGPILDKQIKKLIHLTSVKQ